jgi:hypothetical protein
MQLPTAQREPDPAARPQRWRLLDLGQSQQAAVEPTGLRLASGRSGELNMIDRGGPRVRVEIWR